MRGPLQGVTEVEAVQKILRIFKRVQFELGFNPSQKRIEVFGFVKIAKGASESKDVLNSERNPARDQALNPGNHGVGFRCAMCKKGRNIICVAINKPKPKKTGKMGDDGSSRGGPEPHLGGLSKIISEAHLRRTWSA